MQYHYYQNIKLLKRPLYFLRLVFINFNYVYVFMGLGVVHMEAGDMEAGMLDPRELEVQVVVRCLT